MEIVFGLNLWTEGLFTPFLIILGVELTLFLGFLGWLLVGLRQRDRREQRADSFREEFLEVAEKSEGDEGLHDRWADTTEAYRVDIVRDVLLELIQADDPPVERRELVDFYRSQGYADDHLRALQSDSHARRLEALRALIGVAQPEDIETIRTSVSDSNIERTLAARIAANAGAPEDVVDILRDMHLESRLMEEPVFAVLDNMPSSQFARIFDAWEGFESPGMKRVLLRVAANLGIEDCREQIREAAQSPELELRTAACDAAAELDDAGLIEVLHNLLEDDHPAVRARAATALGRHESPKAIEALQHTMSDPEFWVRQNAAASLRRMGEKGFEALREVAEQSEDSFAVDTARQELERYDT